MSRQLISIVASALLATTPVLADGALEATAQADDATDEIGDQAIGAAVGIATGGRVTPGGLRIAGNYLYQLSSQDWFDGTASFTFGGRDAACYRDRMDLVICDHGYADGGAIEITAGVRRMFAAQGRYRPFARAGVGISVVRFGSDDVSGLAVPLHIGAGVRAHVERRLALVAQGELVTGIGRFTRGLGIEPQLGFTVTAGAEFRLP